MGSRISDVSILRCISVCWCWIIFCLCLLFGTRSRTRNCIYALEPHQRGRALQKKITQSRIIKSNAWEIDNLLNALGICGILSSDRAPCYAEEFCDEYQRSPETDSELLYPLNWWRACDGINKKRYEIVFGKPFHGPVSIV